jgi:hypothetical protein
LPTTAAQGLLYYCRELKIITKINVYENKLYISLSSSAPEMARNVHDAVKTKGKSRRGIVTSRDEVYCELKTFSSVCI